MWLQKIDQFSLAKTSLWPRLRWSLATGFVSSGIMFHVLFARFFFIMEFASSNLFYVILYLIYTVSDMPWFFSPVCFTCHFKCQHFFPLKKRKKKFAAWHWLLPFSSYFAWRGHMCHGNIFKEVDLDWCFFGLVFLGFLVRRNWSHCSLYLDTTELIWDFFFSPLCFFPFFYFFKHILSVQKSVLENTLSCGSPH